MSKSGSDTVAAATVRELRVSGVDCAGCAAAIERAVGGLDGVTEVSVDVMRGTVRVAREGGRPENDVRRAIKRAGYAVVTPEDAETRRPVGRQLAAIASGSLLGIGLLLGWTGASLNPVPFLAAAVVTGGWYVAPRGWHALRAGALDINFLMTLAAIGAAVIGEWAEAGSAMFLFAVAQLLEGYAMGRARRAIGALVRLAPREALVRRGAVDVTVPVDQIAIGELMIVRPGERIALDGVVVTGRSAVDQSPITGESLPVEKETGSEVFAGSINAHGGLEVRVTHFADDTTLAHILHAVESAQASRAPTQTFVDRFARIYTPVVVGLSLLVAVLPPLLADASWMTWLHRALTLLVVACPCALVISTPVTIVSGLAGAARDGVLIKGGSQLEAAGRVTTVAFDKTGTLTAGRPVVTSVTGIGGFSEAEVLRLAAGIERRSEHPVAAAIVRAAEDRGLAIPDVAEFSATPGQGAGGLVEGRQLYVGNVRVCEALGNCHDGAHQQIETLEREGRTAVLLTTAETALGVIGIADRPRPGAAAAIRALRDAGVNQILLLTGDNPGAAERVGREVGVDRVYASLLPAEKQEVVTRLRAAGVQVAVVGDGINDAPALATANVGIAMGAAGTHVALETADIVLMGDDLDQVAGTISRSRATVAIIKQNVAFALLTKAVFLVLAVAGVATLWMAVAADTGASLVVIANGLRAMRRRAILPAQPLPAELS